VEPSVLQIDDPRPAWGAHAHHGRWGERDVVCLLGPHVDGVVERSQQRSEPFVGRAIEGVLPLLAVLPHEGRAAWVYPHVDGITMAPLVDGELVPVRIAALLIAAVAERLVQLESHDLAHPGPAPDDVVIEADASVRLLGLVGPTFPDPGRHDPGERPTRSETSVYRLGALLVELLTGSTPPAANSDTAHDAMLRHILIRIMSRPGPLFPERYRDWVMGMLARTPSQRPPLKRVASGLRELVEELPGPELQAWAAEEVPRRSQLAMSSARPDQRNTERVDVRHLRRRPEMPTLEAEPTREALRDAGEISRDDITAISHGTPSGPPSLAPMEAGAIPVTVGPPVEVARKRPSLPSDLFTESVTGAAPELVPLETTEAEQLPPWLPRGKALTAVAVTMSALAIALAFYVYLWD
jgi:hypothetical protein